ncbi:MAG: hypothetical protein ACOC1K_05520 [Nanoarchaeota archaeon]
MTKLKFYVNMCCVKGYKMSTDKKHIMPVKAEEIKKFRDEFGCSLFHARAVIEERNMHEYIDNAESIDELKKILHILTVKVYKYER